MSKNFVDYDDITAIARKLKTELDKKAVVVPITQEEYDQLSPAEQNNGTIYFITNYNGTSGTNNNIVNNIVRGYYKTADGKIYNEPGFTTEVVKSANYLYIDLGSNDLYIYDTTNGEYVLVSGGGDGIKSIKMNGSTVQSSEQGEVNLGTVLTSHQDISGKQDKATAVKYGGSAAVGSATKGVYVDTQGNATAMTYELNKTVPADAKFSDTNTTYTITQDANDGHKFTFTGSDGTSKTITIPDNNTTCTLSSLGIGDVKNLDQSKAIKTIERNGTTFTYTCLDGSTGTFTQQDNNTWTAMVGATNLADGSAGYVPAPPSDGYNTKFLRADGTWATPDGLLTYYERNLLESIPPNFMRSIYYGYDVFDITEAQNAGTYNGIAIRKQIGDGDYSNIIGVYIEVYIGGYIKDTKLVMFHPGEHKAVFADGKFDYPDSQDNSANGDYSISFMDFDDNTANRSVLISFQGKYIEDKQDAYIKVPFDNEVWGFKMYPLRDNTVI